MAKTDMERIGVFSQSGYTTIGDPYRSPSSGTFNESAMKGKQMLIGGTKAKTATQSGYFGKSFDRIQEGEAYTDMVKLRRQQKLQGSKKNIGTSWTPSSGSKQPLGQGSHYGTFSGPVDAFSAATKPKEKYKAHGKNFLTSPGKKGTGFGYVGVTLGPSYKYKPDSYDRAKEMRRSEQKEAKKKEKGNPFKLKNHPKDVFDENPYHSKKVLPPVKEPKPVTERPQPFKPSSPAKAVGGCKAGTFDSYPKHSEEPYSIPKSKPHNDSTVGKSSVFRPSPGPKLLPTASIMQKNVTRVMNSSNFQDFSTN